MIIKLTIEYFIIYLFGDINVTHISYKSSHFLKEN